MSLISDSVLFIIDSDRRANIDDPKSSGSNFQFKIEIPKGHDFDRVCLLQAIIPKSYWLVNAPYNTMTLIEKGVSTTITIGEGNYNVRNWCTLTCALLTAHSQFGWTYAITFPNEATDISTGYFTYSVSGNGTDQPSFTFPSLGVHEQFGFHSGTTNTFVANTLVSSHVIKFQVADVILIHSDISSNSDQSNYTDVLQEIYASSSPNFTNIIYQNTGNVEAYSKKLQCKDNNIFSFYVTDEDNTLINLRGLTMVFTIIVYKKDDINQIIAKSLLLNKNSKYLN